MSNHRQDVRDFLFRGLMFEAEASAFQAAGIQVGADTSQAEERLLSEALSPFNVSSRNNALEMARLYAVLHCFENEIRNLIRETLQEKLGVDWAETRRFGILSRTIVCSYRASFKGFTCTLPIGIRRLASSLKLVGGLLYGRIVAHWGAPSSPGLAKGQAVPTAPTRPGYCGSSLNTTPPEFPAVRRGPVEVAFQIADQTCGGLDSGAAIEAVRCRLIVGRIHLDNLAPPGAFYRVRAARKAIGYLAE